MRATHAWLALGAQILAWELTCTKGQLLSEEADRWIERHPVATRAAIAVVALHLANALPTAVDPIHHATRLRRHR